MTDLELEITRALDRELFDHENDPRCACCAELVCDEPDRCDALLSGEYPELQS